MTINLWRSRRRVKVPTKFGDTICALNDKNNDQSMEPDEELQNDKSNDGNEEIRRNSRSNVNITPSTIPCNVSPIPMQVNVQFETIQTWIGSGNVRDNYAEKVANNDNKLEHIPTVLNENGQEFVIFDEEIVTEGSKNWELSACGYFVGYRMSIQELGYHLYRMWSKFGLKHILNNGNGVFVFKFDNKQYNTPKLGRSGIWVGGGTS
ncbi:hypothetical protein Tco_0582646 [Tanacetum coccineum]